MKKLFLILCMIEVLFSLHANAQTACTPSVNQTSIDNPIYPISLPDGYIGLPYNAQLDILIPQMFFVAGVGQIDMCSVKLDSIQYLSAGLNYSCGGASLSTTTPNYWVIDHAQGVFNNICISISGNPTNSPSPIDSIRLCFSLTSGTNIGTSCFPLTTTKIQITARLKINLFGLGDDKKECGNGSSILCFAGMPNNSTYSWSYNNTPISNNTACYTVPNASGAGTYIVNATDPSNNQFADTIAISYFPAISNLALYNTSNCSIMSGFDTLTAVPSGGTLPYNYAWTAFWSAGLYNTLSNNNSVAISTPATYACKIVDANGCMANDSILVSTCTPTCQIKGKLYIDNNGNGVYDAGEIPIKNHFVSHKTFYPNNAWGYANYEATDSLGDFILEADTIGNHEIQPWIYNWFYNTPIPFSPNNYTNISFPNANMTASGKDFTCAPFIELSTCPSYISAIPGTNMHYYLPYNNFGNPTNNVTLYFNAPPQLTFVNSSIAPTGQSGNTFSWNFPALAGNSFGYVDLTFYAPTTLALGTILNVSDSISLLNGELYANNNAYSWTTIVVSSYDPNIKTVSNETLTPAEVEAQKPLFYTIHFQNTGTAPAQKIVIQDTLSYNLEMESFQMLGASHNYTLSIKNPNILIWTFDNIMLPDSNSNEAASHGFLSYKMNPKTNLQLGDEIHNRAAIYFDYNAPVITNDAITKVAYSLGVENQLNTSNIKIYPNPAKNELYLEWEKNSLQNANVRILDIQGKTLLEEKITNHTENAVLSLEKLSNGMYFILISSEKNTFSARFIKE